jgi:hypothetical protein
MVVAVAAGLPVSATHPDALVAAARSRRLIFLLAADE